MLSGAFWAYIWTLIVLNLGQKFQKYIALKAKKGPNLQLTLYIAYKFQLLSSLTIWTWRGLNIPSDNQSTPEYTMCWG